MTPETKKRAGIVAICIACIAPAEGLRRVAYSDPIGIPTICFGETQNPDGSKVKLGQKATTKECEGLLAERVERDFIPGVERCAPVPMPDTRKAALTSFAYNVGVETFCKSSVARNIAKGDVQGGCDALLLYTKAGGITLPGLVKRRQSERELCLQIMS